ncbi:MAG: DUF2061 domain-containing protein [Candidatus Thiodiazotropha sp.]
MLLSFADKKAERRSQQAVSSDRPIRSLAKAISWRVTGSIDTILLSWFFTGNLTTAAAIGLTEVVTKMVLYYLHERVWNRIGLGRAELGGYDEKAVLQPDFGRSVKDTG